MSEQERRDVIRRAYDCRCGYCGVHEEEAGSELEIDHFRPRAVGGGDELENLVYCCPTCNRLKGDFWPPDGSSATRRLLHPRRDDLSEHLHEEADGHLTPLTETGAFHIKRLKLNRPPLVALRRTRLEVANLRQDLAAAQAEQVRVRKRIAALEEEIEEILIRLTRLLR